MADKRSLHGVVLLDKPTGMSSNRALQRVKHLLGAKKAGHTGSLDPLATGLLPLCLGQATKVSEYLLGSSKRYTTIIKLGETTDTLDAEGSVTGSFEVNVSDAQLHAAVDKFRGEIEQIPPMYSALKKQGQPLYKLARQGQEVERAPRKMTVHEVHAVRLDERRVELNVHCSSGFYIRSLADDIGAELGCGAHVAELRRTGIKNIGLAQTVSLDELESHNDPDTFIQPIDCLIQDFPALRLSAGQVEDIRHGRKPAAQDLLGKQVQGDGLCRFYAPDERLLAIGEVTPNGQLKARKLFVMDA